MVGGYTLVSRLGGGAMGTVWTVHDDAGQTFAMKILRDSLTEEDANPQSTEYREQLTARERLRREALALSRVRHPGVASIVDMELDDALAFIVTELIDGDTLREDVAKNGPYTGEDLELLTEKLSSAVEAVHKAGLIHRDIKPTNVMIAAAGPVLVDFGIAMGEGESHVTRTGLVMGTPGFIAPEVIEGNESDIATDWWSVASVLAFAATGKPVFGTKPIMAVLEREASGNADLAGLPPRTTAAFRAALSPDRSQRISAVQLLSIVRQDALDAAQASPTTAFPALNLGSTPDETGVVHPFDAGSSFRKEWVHDPAALTGDFAVPGTVALGQADAPTMTFDQSDLPGGTRLMPVTPAAGPVETADPPTQAMYAPAPTETVALNQPAPATVPVQVPAPAPLSEEFAAPAIIPQSELLDTEVTQRYHGTGAPLAALLAVPIALIAACLPVGAAIIALVIQWLATARGYSLKAQILRQTKRGRAAKRSDGAVSVIAAPWHLVRAVVTTLPSVLLWVLAAVVVNFLSQSLTSLPLAHSGVTLADRSFIYSLLAGSPRSASGVILGLAAAAVWLLVSLVSQRSAVRIGLAWAWNAMMHAGSPPPSPDLVTQPDGTLSDPSRGGAATNPPRRSRVGAVLAILLVALTLAAVVTFLALGSIDWSPIVLWTV